MQSEYTWNDKNSRNKFPAVFLLFQLSDIKFKFKFGASVYVKRLNVIGPVSPATTESLLLSVPL